MDDNTINIAT